MEDEGYTSPHDELAPGQDCHISDLTTSASDIYPYRGRLIRSWEDLHIRKANVNFHSTQPFFTDSHLLASAEFPDWIWRVASVRNDLGSLAVIKSSIQEITYIPMFSFISHLIHLLNGRESQSFEYKNLETHLFRRNSYVLVKGLSPTSMDTYSQMFIECGGRFRKLWALSNQNPHSLSGANTLFTTFQKAIGDYLKIYQTIIMLKGQSMTTFTKLQSFIQPFHHQLEVLVKIADLAINESPVTLLSELNRLIFTQETPYIVDLLRSFFVIIASTYMRYISDWIFRGELGPPTEFHIKSLRDGIVVKDRRFWTRHFVQSEEVPLFIEESADLIFETGKSINLFNFIKSMDHPASSYLFAYDTDQIVTPCFSFDDLHECTLEWNDKLSRFLSENSHLTTEVRRAITEVLSDSLRLVDVDFNTVDATRLRYENRVSEVKASNLRKKQSRQREFRLSLQQQVDESINLKSAERLRDQIEDESNLVYNVRKEKEYDEEKIKFHEKYFPTEKFEKERSVSDAEENENGNKTLELAPSLVNEVEQPKNSVHKWDSVADDEFLCRLLSGRPFVAKVGVTVVDSPLQSLPNRIYSSNISNSSPPRVGQLLDLTPPKLADVDEVDSPKREVQVRGGITTRKRNYNKKQAISIEEILAFKQEGRKQHQCHQLESVMDEAKVNKLDPEKFILTKSIPIPDFNVQIFNEKPKGLILVTDEDTPTKKSSSNIDASCVNLMFAQSVAIPLKSQHQMVNTALLHYFVKEKRLFHHISALNDFLLLQNGVFGHSLSTLLIEEVKKSPLKSTADLSKKTGRLIMLLNEALSITFVNQDPNPLVNNLSFTLVQEKDVLVKELVDLESGKINQHISSEFQILNALRLNYSVEWPLNIILTNDMMHHYENLFGIFMQLLRSELLLEQVFMHLKCKRSKSAQVKKLQLYHHKLLHFVHALRFYMNVVVVHAGWTDFCSSLYVFDSIQKIYDHLVRYVRDISSNCFLSFSSKGGGILKLVIRHLAIIDSFCSQLMRSCVLESIDWDNGVEMSQTEFLTLRRKFAAAEQFQKIFLTTLYKASGKEAFPKIDAFLELYDFNNFYDLLVLEKESKTPILLKTTSVPGNKNVKVSTTVSTTSFYL